MFNLKKKLNAFMPGEVGSYRVVNGNVLIKGSEGSAAECLDGGMVGT